MAILRRHRKNRKVIDCAVFLEGRPLLLLAREGKIIRVERDTKHRLCRQWASNLTKTFISESQTGYVKFTTSIAGIVKHLSYLRNLYKIFFRSCETTVSHKSFLTSSNRASQWKNLTATLIQSETITAKYCHVATTWPQANQAALKELFLMRQSLWSM